MTTMVNPSAASPGKLAADGREDPLLAERFAQGDRAAFAEIVAAYQGRVGRLVQRLLGWQEDADDVVQEVFLRAWKSARRFRGESSLATWLTRIAVNACRKDRRRRLGRLRLFGAAAARASSSPLQRPERGDLDPDTFERVRRAVRKLPARYREIVVLRYLEEMPAEKVAQVLGVSRGAVDTRLHRAREKLRKSLNGLMKE